MEFFHSYDTFKKSEDGKKRLNIGCGDYPQKGYVNLDIHNSKADIKEDFFVFAENGHENEFDEVLASHLLEHIARPRTLEFLEKCLRILKPGCSISIVVPDFDYIAECWTKYQETWKWIDLHNRVYGLQTHEGEYHRSAWNKNKLARALLSVGFVEVWTAYGWDHDQRTILAGAKKPLQEVVKCRSVACGEYNETVEELVQRVEE